MKSDQHTKNFARSQKGASQLVSFKRRVGSQPLPDCLNLRPAEQENIGSDKIYAPPDMSGVDASSGEAANDYACRVAQKARDLWEDLCRMGTFERLDHAAISGMLTGYLGQRSELWSEFHALQAKVAGKLVSDRINTALSNAVVYLNAVDRDLELLRGQDVYGFDGDASVATQTSASV
jgi:hypothetical protein